MKNIILVSLLFLFFNGFSQFGGSPFSQSALYINQQIPFCPSVDSCLGLGGTDSTLVLSKKGAFVHFPSGSGLWSASNSTLFPVDPSNTLYAGSESNSIQSGDNTRQGLIGSFNYSTNGSAKSLNGATSDLSQFGGDAVASSFIFSFDTITGDQGAVFVRKASTGFLTIDLATIQNSNSSRITISRDGIISKFVDSISEIGGGSTVTQSEAAMTYGPETGAGAYGIRMTKDGADFKTNDTVWRFSDHAPTVGKVLGCTATNVTDWIDAVGTQNLQQVTDIGNTTTNPIIIEETTLNGTDHSKPTLVASNASVAFFKTDTTGGLTTFNQASSQSPIAVFPTGNLTLTNAYDPVKSQTVILDSLATARATYVSDSANPSGFTFSPLSVNGVWADRQGSIKVSSLNHITGTSGAPSISAGAGAGTSPSIGIVGTNLSGRIAITTGTLPSLGSTIVTITYNSLTYPNGSYVVLFPQDAVTAAAFITSTVSASGTPNTFVVKAGATALTAATSLTWTYMVVGN